MKVIKIDGFRGLLNAVFIGGCLFAGFVVSPGYVAMYLWNRYLVNDYMFPQLSLFQGILLWAIVFLSYSILTKGRFAVSFQSSSDIRDEELESILRSAKINSQLKMMNKIISNSDSFNYSGKNPYLKENKEDTTASDDNGEDKISEIK